MFTRKEFLRCDSCGLKIKGAKRVMWAITKPDKSGVREADAFPVHDLRVCVDGFYGRFEEFRVEASEVVDDGWF